MKVQRMLRSAVADQLYSDIANTDESRHMFQEEILLTT